MFRWKILVCWMFIPLLGAALKAKPHLQGVSTWTLDFSRRHVSHVRISGSIQSKLHVPAQPSQNSALDHCTDCILVVHSITL